MTKRVVTTESIIATIRMAGLTISEERAAHLAPLLQPMLDDIARLCELDLRGWEPSGTPEPHADVTGGTER